MPIAAADNPASLVPKDPATGRYKYQGVVTVDGVPSDELYRRAKAWVAAAYESSTDVIKLDDQPGGQLIARGSFTVPFFLGFAWVKHTWTIEIKDGRYRYTLTDYLFDTGSWSAPLEEDKSFIGTRKSIFTRVRDNSEGMIVGLKEAMLKPSPSMSSDW